jgi:GT2 family glycosyltransferase
MSSARSEPARVTIVIVALSVRKELERCLGSIEQHGGMPVDIVVVDNASTDDTREWLASDHPDVTLVALAKNKGTAAREDGLQRVRTPYAMFIDTDAALTPGALPAMVAALDEHPDWGLVGPRLVYDDGSLQLSCRRFPPLALPFLRRPPLSRLFENRRAVRHHLMADEDHSRPRPVTYVLGACQLFRMSHAHAAGVFPQIFWGWDDAEWCIRIRDAGGEIVYLPSAEVVHSYRRTTKRQPVSRQGWRQLRAFVYFQRKYWRRRRELRRLEDELDRRAQIWAASSP